MQTERLRSDLGKGIGEHNMTVSRNANIKQGISKLSNAWVHAGYASGFMKQAVKKLDKLAVDDAITEMRADLETKIIEVDKLRKELRSINNKLTKLLPSDS